MYGVIVRRGWKMNAKAAVLECCRLDGCADSGGYGPLIYLPLRRIVTGNDQVPANKINFICV